MAIKTIYHFDALTGGTSTALDSIDGNSLLDKDRAIVFYNDVVYYYELDADSGAAESSPSVIKPDTNAGTKRWVRITPSTIAPSDSLTYEVDALATYGSGTNYTEDTLTAAIAGIGATESIMLLQPGTWVIAAGDSDVTIPANVCLKMPHHTTISIATGRTLTINGPVDFAGLDQRFSCAGTGKVVFGSVSTVYPEWWGAVGDASTTTRTGTDDTAAVQAAITSMTNGGTLKISKWYGIVGTLTSTWTNGLKTTVDNVITDGIGKGICGFVLVSPTYPGYVFRDNDESKCTGWEFRNVGFYGTATFSPHTSSAAASCPIRFYQFQDISIHDCAFYDFSIAGAFYGGLGTNPSLGISFYHNHVEGINGTPYLGFGVVYGSDVWVLDNEFVNVALGVSFETFNAPDAPYDITHFHVNHNTFKNSTVATHSTTNAAIPVQVHASSGNEVAYGEIHGNVIVGLSEGVDATSGSPGAVVLLGDSGDQGNVHDISIIGNVTDIITADASTPTIYGIYAYNCKALVIQSNIIGDVTPGGTSSYGIRLTDTSLSNISGNIIHGTGWTLSLSEAATIECNNTFALNTSENGAVYSNITTSKSMVFENNPANARMDWLIDVWSVRIGEDGKFLLGRSNANYDTNFYSSAASVLKTDDSLSAAVAEHADNAAAVAAGLAVGQMYRTGDDLKIVH